MVDPLYQNKWGIIVFACFKSDADLVDKFVQVKLHLLGGETSKYCVFNFIINLLGIVSNFLIRVTNQSDRGIKYPLEILADYKLFTVRFYHVENGLACSNLHFAIFIIKLLNDSRNNLIEVSFLLSGINITNKYLLLFK